MPGGWRVEVGSGIMGAKLGSYGWGVKGWWVGGWGPGVGDVVWGRGGRTVEGEGGAREGWEVGLRGRL